VQRNREGKGDPRQAEVPVERRSKHVRISGSKVYAEDARWQGWFYGLPLRVYTRGLHFQSGGVCIFACARCWG
jgi:hypothetical protein